MRGGVVLAEGAGEAAERVTALSGWRSRVGGAHSGQVFEAGFCVEGEHDALSLQRVRGDDEVVRPPGHSSPADVRDQPGMAGRGRFGVLQHVNS